MTVGIIGGGFVGGALKFGFEDLVETRVYDTKPDICTHSLEETVLKSKYIFVCVPTPMNKSLEGKADDRIILSTLSQIDKLIKDTDQKILVIKSSVPPGSMEKFSHLYPSLRLVFNPEFLTEKNAKDDFINCSRIVLGGSKKDTLEVANLYRARFPDTKIIETDYQTSQFIKYLANCFFAVKVSYMNEMYQLAKELNIDWEKAVEGFSADRRVGQSHLNVPGPDGSLGFGGKCFPKDINAIIHVMKGLGLDPVALQSAWQKNLEVREDKDWESIIGATSE